MTERQKTILSAILLVLVIFATSYISYSLDKYLERSTHPTPTLTGEYGQPDGRTTLTGPYVEQGK